MMELENGEMRPFEMYDNIAEFIETYENTQEKKKSEKKETKKLKGLEKFLED
jgi:cell shape-determining protein MreC